MDMNAESKLSLKRVEISLKKFNDVAIPHHLDLLRQHRTNIIKFRAGGDYASASREQVNAGRVAAQLRHLLEELAALRSRVEPAQQTAFDSRTHRARVQALTALQEYLDTQEGTFTRKSSQSSVGYLPTPATSSPELPNVSQDEAGAPQLQLVVDERELELQRLREKEACLAGWQRLQGELRDLHDLFTQFHGTVLSQKDDINTTAENVQVAETNVSEGRFHLRGAERYRLAMYPLSCAVLGGCVAGPLGLLVGAKVGGLALLGGSLLGAASGVAIRKRRLAAPLHAKQD